MGRKKKYGEESSIECFRVPKRKKKEYRKAINKFIERKYEKDLNSKDLGGIKTEEIPQLEGYRKFEEFLQEIKKIDEKEKDNSKKQR